MDKITKQRLIQTIMAAGTIFTRIKAEEEKTTGKINGIKNDVEIDINCRKAIQAGKIYALLILVIKNDYPMPQELAQEVNKTIVFLDPELKKAILELAHKDGDGNHLVPKKIETYFPGLITKN